MKKHYVLFTTILIIAFAVFNQIQASDTIQVQVNCRNELGLLRRSELFNSNSLLRTPTKAMTDKYKKEIGITKIMKCWVTINDYWNWESDKYNYNFKCGWSDQNLITTLVAEATANIFYDNFYDYMERFSVISEEILLNVRGCEAQVLQNKITMNQWREACKNGIYHYKKLYPKIKYVEALNEYRSFAKINDDQYYQYYQEFYKIINEVNTELKPEVLLLLGGPVVHGSSLIDGTKREQIRAFLKNYASDKNPDKKLDFISYHEYRAADDPSIVAGQEELIDNWCREFGLPVNIPIFVSEMGGFEVNTRFDCLGNDQVTQAAGINSLFYFYNKQPDLQAFNWVIQHVGNERKNQIYDNLQWSPYGISLKIQAKMAKTQISAETPALTNGKGIYALASKDNDRVVVQVWNYQWSDGKKTCNVRLNLENLPESFKDRKVKVNEYLLDSDDNNFNCIGIITKPGVEQLTITNKTIIDQKNIISLRAVLEPNAIILFELIPE